MSRVPVYPIGSDLEHGSHATDKLIADAYGNMTEVAGWLDGAISASMEFIRNNLRRVQGMLTRSVNGGIRRIDANVRRSSEQLDSRVASATAEIAGTLRGINGIVGTSRAVRDELDRTRPPLPSVVRVKGSRDATPIFQIGKTPAQAGASVDTRAGSRPLVTGLQAGGGALQGEDAEASTDLPGIGYVAPQTESVTSIGGAISTGPDSDPVLSWGDNPPPGIATPAAPEKIHPELRPLTAVPGIATPAQPGVCCPPAPVVNVTVQPAPIDVTGLAQFIAQVLQRRQPPIDAFPQAPESGAEPEGFDPSQVGDVIYRERAPDFDMPGEALPALPDNSAIIKSAAAHILAALSLAR